MSVRRRRRSRSRIPESRPESQSTIRTGRRRRAWLLLGLLLVATLIAYQPAWRGSALWDDDGHITRSDLRSVEGLGRIWFDLGATQQYYPLVHSTFWVLHRLCGDDTLGYHLLNIVLHGLSAFLFALILQRLGVRWPWLAAAIFALHPVQVESVAWISELKNTQSAVLFLASALAYLHFDESRLKRTYGLASGLFVLALLSKTVTATLPALLLVICWWRRGKVSVRRDVVPLGPWLVAGAASGALTAWTERTLIGAYGTEFGLTAVDRFLVAGRAFWFYLSKLFWPVDLAFIYPRWQVSTHQWWQFIYPAAVIALLAGLWLWRKRTRAPLAAILIFGVALSPALGLVDVYPFRYSFVADHFQYLASLGIIALFAGSIATLAGTWTHQARSAPAAAAILILAPLGFLTWHYSRDYVDAETLYRATIARSPSSWMAHNNLAVLLLPRSTEDAEAHLREALKYNPDYPEAHNNLGLALQMEGRYEDAATEHRRALQLEPAFAEAHVNLGSALQRMGRLSEASGEYAEAVRLRPRALQAQANLGSVLLQSGQLERAVAHLREALRLDPSHASVHFNLATALERSGHVEEAIGEFEETLRLDPGSAGAHAGLGSLLEKMGRLDEALRHDEARVELEPGSTAARLALGDALYRKGEMERAAREYLEAIRIEPGSGVARNNLGACFDRLGRLKDAVAQYQEAVRLLPQSADARANLARTSAALAFPH